MTWDVAVIGSGPAGSALAIQCRQAGLSVSIFTLPVQHARAEIPETLPAAAHPLLQTLGIARSPVRFGLCQQYAMSSAWGSDSLTTRQSICNPSGPGWFVDRRTFDAQIAQEAANDGVVPVTHARVVSASRRPGHWLLRFQPPQKPELEVKARTVVDATGRAAEFAGRLGYRRTAFDRLISVTARALPRGLVAGAALVESAPDGWWFSAPAPCGELSVSWFTDGSLLRPADRTLAAMEGRLRATTHTRERVASLLPHAFRCRSARTDRLDRFGGDGWIAVGDAAVACDPLGSYGLSQAFASAGIARETILRDGACDPGSHSSYCEFHTNYLQRFLRERHQFYAMERRWPGSAFWSLPREEQQCPQ